MQIILTNSINGADFLDFAFGAEEGLDIQSVTSTTVVIRNPETGGVTTVTGTGFVFDPNSGFSAGTVNGWTTDNSGGQRIVTVTGISWSAPQFNAAVDAAFENDNEGPLMALFSLQPVTVDASNYQQPAQIFADGISSAFTIRGSNFGDTIEGGNGNDLLNPGTSSVGGRGDTLIASPGNDTYNFADVTLDATYTEIAYSRLNTGIIATITGTSNEGTVTKGANGTDALLNMANALNWDSGFGLFGTSQNDVFNITAGPEQFIEVFGGRGVDSYNLTLAGGEIRLNFSGNFDEWMGATSGAVVNLATGIVANDGFGNFETITVSGSQGRINVTGTMRADNIIGSHRDEVFITNGGNDTIDGGGGFDRVRYDRREATSGVTVDLAAGTATGSVNNVAFSQTLISIEDVRGTNDFGDSLTGSAANNRLDGRGGDDTLMGGGGDDTLIGGSGNDLIMGGSGSDIAIFAAMLAGSSVTRLADGSLNIIGAAGNDTIAADVEFFQFNDAFRSYAELVAQATGITPIVGTDGAENVLGTGGDDILMAGGGNDWITPGAGSDTVDGGSGVDMVSFVDMAQRVVVDLGAGTAISGADVNILHNIENVTGSIFADLITGDDGNNLIRGLGDYDWMVGSWGNDTYDGGTGRDTVAYSSAPGGVVASLLTKTGTGGQAAGDSYVSVENLTGSSHADTLAGDNDRNVLRGLGGDDIIFGHGGNDTIDGGAGRDYLFGGDGNDRITGGRGNDTIDGGRGWDTALYSGNRADYDVVSNADGTTSVFHARGTRNDGIDLLINVEVLEFVDGRIFLA